MQLNNTTTGHSIKLDKIDILNNRVIYTEYQLTGAYPYIEGQKPYTFTSINIKDFLKVSTNYEELCLNTLKIELNLTDYQLSEDEQNWLFSERPARVIIKSSFVLKELQPIDASGNLSPIGQIIEREKIDNFGFYIDNPDDEISVLYVNQVAPEDQEIINPYIGTSIFIENKII